MPEPIQVEPTATTSTQRAARVHALLKQAGPERSVTGTEVSRETFVDAIAEEIEAALAAAREELEAAQRVELDAIAQQRDAALDEIANRDAQLAAQAQKHAALVHDHEVAVAKVAELVPHMRAQQAKIDALEVDLAACRAALADALSKATQVGDVTGTIEQWEKRLAASPAVARFEIDAWREVAIRRLATIGTTQADVMIARLASMLLAPYNASGSVNA